MADPIVSGLVHDLRNPINSIAMTAELAKLQLERGESPEKVISNLDTIVRICRECGVRLEEVSEGQGSDHAVPLEGESAGSAPPESPPREDDGTRRVD